MNGFTQTRFANTDDPSKMAQQIAQSVNAIEVALQKLPLYFGDFDPNNNISAQAGSIYIRTGAQGKNEAAATPHLYIKMTDGTSNGWISLLFLGTQPQTDVSANRGSLYLKLPKELASSAALYFKSSDDATPDGWSAL